MEGLNRDDFNWTDNPVVGAALLIQGGSTDSFGNRIDGDVYYEVGKQKVTGQVVISPTDRNQKHDFANRILKEQGRLN